MKTQEHLQLMETVEDAFKGEYFFGIEQILDELDDGASSTQNTSVKEPDWFGVAVYTL